MNVLLELQKWYQSHCDGEWEQHYGIEIGNLDNPGWRVEIDLIGTNLENKTFEEIQIDNSEEDWIFCKTEKSKFLSFGDPQKLERILRTFIEWSNS